MTKQSSSLPQLDEEVKVSLDLRGGKTVSTYILVQVVDSLSSLQPGEAIYLVTDVHAGLGSDIKAWGRLTNNDVREVPWKSSKGETDDNSKKYERYIIVKKDVTVDKDSEQKQHVAIIISQDGLEELLSPLGFALGAITSGMHVSLYFQGPAVHALRRGFKGRLSGVFSAPFSHFARRGMAAMGHAPPAAKIEQLHRLGAKFYACHPSLEHFGVRVSDMAFPEDVVLAEYVTFLEVMRSATVKLYP